MRRALLLPTLLLAACAQGGSQEPGFRIVNRTPLPVMAVNASPSSDQRWGANRLPAPLPPGTGAQITFPRGVECRHDVRAVLADGRSEQRMGIDICANPELVLGTAPAASGGGGNPSFNLVNRDPRRVAQLYASPASFPAWGPDHLGGGGVPPGGIAPIRLPLGECAYDMRIVYGDGQTEERRGVNLCAVINVILGQP
ncbi:MAG: hypothetical protein K2X11_02190 [Acetobacteraceae bacterium]|nr:hypothetical protein [Acetobacteraceae bacterium]